MDKARRQKKRQEILRNEYIKTTVKVKVVPLDDSLKKYADYAENKIDTAAWEKLFHNIPQNELEVMVCLYLGMEPKEIVEVLHFKNITRFYDLVVKIKEVYKNQKWMLF